MNILSYLYLCSLPMVLGREQNHSNYSVLILTSFAAVPSHSIYFDAIAQQLAKRGHQVTHRWTGRMESSAIGVNNYEAEPFKHSFGSTLYFEMSSIIKTLHFSMTLVPKLVKEGIDLTYKDPLLADLVEQPLHPITNNPKYDVLIIDVFLCDIYIPLAHHLGVPYMLVSTTPLWYYIAWQFDIPFHSFLNVRGQADSLSVLSRLISYITQTVFAAGLSYVSREVEQNTRNYLPNVPSMNELAKNVSFITTANTVSMHDSIPSTPIVLHTGCAQCRPAKQLPPNLEDVMQRSGDHGVIYFSLGSFIDSSEMPKDFKEKVIRALSRFNQTILWKGRLGETHPPNFHVNEWFPQQDVIAHPKVVLTITHGGIGTAHEATYHGCPILGFPLNFDQNYNAYISKKIGFGEHLNWRTFTEDELHETITRMLSNKSYKEAAMRTSIRMRDSLDSPCEQAAYWTEYIVRHKGAPFLSNQPHRLHWHQYFLLDVIALLLTITAIVITLAWLTLKSIIKAILRCAKIIYEWMALTR